jgi:DNA modification methylase
MSKAKRNDSDKKSSIDIVQYKLGEVRFCNCLNEEYGLPSLEDNSFDLCFTDPPWGKNMRNNKRKYIDGRTLDNSDKTHFTDTVSTKFNKDHFTQIHRVCKRTVLVIGDELLFWCLKNIDPKPTGIIPVFWKNSPFMCKFAKRRRHSHYLLYGDFDTKFEYSILAKRYSSTSVEPFTYYWGATNKEKHFNHPSPKGLEIPLKVLKQLKPSNLLDPFTGSGTYIRAATILDIPWMAYEINNEEYREDIDYRFNEQLITEWI